MSAAESLDAAMLRPSMDAFYAKYPWEWAKDLVVTRDEATQQQRRWPADKVYIEDLFRAFHTEKMLAIPKSRRMMVSWLAAAYCTHQARYVPNHAIFIQSETEDKSSFLVDKRCAYIEDNLRWPAYRRAYDSLKTAKGLVGRLTYKGTGSYIYAVAQGGNVFRSFTPSILVMDETEFMPEAHESLTAAAPLTEKGGKLILISSSNGPRGILSDVCREIGFVRF